jgi:putative phosphoribosyl transferase
MEEQNVSIPISDQIQLQGSLAVPDHARGLVIFSHGSGSSRFSPRNKQVAAYLRQHGFGTLLFDLLTEDEDVVYANRFNIELLSRRLQGVSAWIEHQRVLQKLPLAYFGASTGAASALKAAARQGDKIKAVVSRGGRPDLALDELEHVRAATLLIVGGRDFEVIDMNRRAFAILPEPKELRIVEGAGHLFEERGKLEEVAELALHWCERYLTQSKEHLFEP